MKARKSVLAERLLADPSAREQFRTYMARRKAVAGTPEVSARSGRVIISFQTDAGEVRVMPTLLSPKIAA